MPVNLSIKNVPDYIVERLRKRAALNHRSLQGELMALLEQTVGPEKQISLAELIDHAERLGVRTPSESVAMIREDRDTDHGRSERD
jgi:antitoxin FitA